MNILGKLIFMIIIIWFEAALLNFTCRDDAGWFPDDVNFTDIENRMEEGEISEQQVLAEKYQKVGTMWIVLCILKFIFMFRSAPLSATVALPVFIYGCELEWTGSEVDAFGTAMGVFFVMAFLMGSLYLAVWHMAGDR